MDLPHDVGGLPTFAALDGYAVLAGRRRGTSIQLDGTYFGGQLLALRQFDADPGHERRTEILENSRRAYDAIEVGIDSLTRAELRDESRRFRRELRHLPEVRYLTRNFPGRCFVVPEWLRTGDRLHYGARVYLFRDDDSPDPEEVVAENVEAVVTDSFDAFERYQGRLHGYPDCCIDFYGDRSTDSPSPEWRSVEPFADRVREDALGGGPSTSIDDVLPAFLAHEGNRAFFAREFFPEPDCETAAATGRAIFEELSSALPDRLVRDYFGLNFGVDYLVARTVDDGGDRRPSPGVLGREHLLIYLPLRATSRTPRYA